jgi:hypothetical protein
VAAPWRGPRNVSLKPHADLDPTRGRVVCAATEPVIVAVDVTASMAEWPQVIYDKLPMFYGQIMMQGYLTDPALCFVGIADVDEDDPECPLQATNFAQGAAIDAQISKLRLGGGGRSGFSGFSGFNGFGKWMQRVQRLGGATSIGAHEAYQLCAHYFLNSVDSPSATRKPIMFITGDEFYYENVVPDQVKKYLDPHYRGAEYHRTRSTESSVDVFRALTQKYDVIHLHRSTEMYLDQDDAICAQWEAVLGREEPWAVRSF